MTDHDPLIDSILGLDHMPATPASEIEQDVKAGEYDQDGRRRPVGAMDSRTITRTVAKRELRRLMREDQAVDALTPLPEPGQETFILLAGHFHGIDLITATQRIAGCPIADLQIATLAINRTHNTLLADMMDTGRIQAMTMMISTHFAEASSPEFNHLKAEIEPRGAKIFTTRNHAKITAMHMADGRKFVIHGSLNLRRCNSYEQAAITQDADLWQFACDFIRDAAEGAIHA